MTKHIELNYTEEKLTYPKMQTLYKRDMDKKTKPIIEGDFSKEEFKLFKRWRVFEKIDGTNVRIFYTSQSDEYILGNIEIRGRKDNSNMPAPLYNYLEEYFTDDILWKAFNESQDVEIILFGEGYGSGIQKGGGLYRDDPGFILFDVKIGNWWLDRDKVVEIAEQLNLPYVPQIGYGLSIDEIVKMIKDPPKSLTSGMKREMEGVVCQSDPLLLFRNGNPLKFKLKVKDFD